MTQRILKVIKEVFSKRAEYFEAKTESLLLFAAKYDILKTKI